MVWLYCLCSYSFCNTMVKVTDVWPYVCIPDKKEILKTATAQIGWAESSDLPWASGCHVWSQQAVLSFFLADPFPFCLLLQPQTWSMWPINLQNFSAPSGEKELPSDQTRPSCKDTTPGHLPNLTYCKKKGVGRSARGGFCLTKTLHRFDVHHGLQEDSPSFPGALAEDGRRTVQKQHVLWPAQYTQTRVLCQLPLPAGADTFG